jgi:hypothetical protein
MNELTKEVFLNLREQGLTFKQIGELYNLTERQVNYRTVNKWKLNYSRKKKLNESFFSSNTKAAYYWAGMLAADGWIEADRNRVGLALQSQDVDHLYKFKLAISSEHDICAFMDGTANRIRFNSIKMVEDLENIFNITSNKTFTYSMPLFEENYLMLEFLRGYIDGDGHLEKTASGRVALHLCSANEKFLQEFKDICEFLLERCIAQNISLKVNKKGQVYSIRLNLDDSRDMLKLLYANSTEKTRLSRKYAIALNVL